MAIRFADSASWCTTAAIGIGAGLKYNYTPAGYGFQITAGRNQNAYYAANVTVYVQWTVAGLPAGQIQPGVYQEYVN